MNSDKDKPPYRYGPKIRAFSSYKAPKRKNNLLKYNESRKIKKVRTIDDENVNLGARSSTSRVEEPISTTTNSEVAGTTFPVNSYSEEPNFPPTLNSTLCHDTDVDHFELTVEGQTERELQAKSFVLQGRRIIDINYFINQLVELGNHSPAFSCTLANMIPINETQRGLMSTITFKCNMCNFTNVVHTSNKDSPDCLDINTSAVIGVMNMGAGLSQMEQLCASLALPTMSSNTYNVVHNKVCDAWDKTALKEMKEAAEEEAKLAIESGDVYDNGTPLITVVCDGSWAKRSYRKNYNSLSGAAAIVGFKTKKVLYLGVRNKFCTVCKRAETENVTPKKHECYRNWTGSSTSMETNIIAEGFCKSLDMYGIIYNRMIADGDSSCYKKILELRPYNIMVEKIECRNHLLRNFCNKLQEINSNTKLGPKSSRICIGNNIMQIRRGIVNAIKHRKSEDTDMNKKIVDLKNDILNNPSHVFGEHRNCASIAYFCKKIKPDEKNLLEKLKQCEAYNKLMEHINNLASHAKSLIHDVDSNIVEQFNAIIAKFTGGKRINFALRRSYQSRCSAAVVSHNTKRPLYKIHKFLNNGISPSTLVQRLELRNKRKLLTTAEQKQKRKEQKAKRKLNFKNNGDEDYGDKCMKPDKNNEDFNFAKEKWLNDLKKTDLQKIDLEQNTKGQSQSPLWKNTRRNLLTASNFGTVCRRMDHTPCAKLVKTLISDVDDFLSTNNAIQWGRDHEDDAIRETEQIYKVSVVKSGLFIDKEIDYLGASPDGLINSDGLVEVKCPFSAQHLTPEEGIKIKKITFWNYKNNTYQINKKHKWYYQIQGQLRITEREYCIFGAWTTKGIKCEIIIKDDVFWEQQIKFKLKRFYEECMLPELIDSRLQRNMPIREPKFILDAIKLRKEKGTTTKAKKK